MTTDSPGGENGMSIGRRIRQCAMQCGASAVGVACCEEVDNVAWSDYDSWIVHGCNGSMGYMANHAEIRRDPQLLLPGARSILVCAFPYFHVEKPDNVGIAMYAHGDDYHTVLRELLKPLERMLTDAGYSSRICVDSAPILERYWAVKAGLGFIGRNHTLIIPGKGSYFFLAEVLTDAELSPDEPCQLSCGDCGRCASACPGGALRSSDGFDARKCLSYLTIEHKGELPETIDGKSVAELVGNQIYGCDICQAVCPHNSNAIPTEIEVFKLRDNLRTLSCEQIFEMTQEEFSTIFRHSPIKRIKLAGLQRNARVNNLRKNNSK